MEKLTNYKYTLNIKDIYSISGGDRRFEILFISKTDGCRYKLIFDFVLDMRYSIENGYIARFYEFRKNLPKDIVDNSLYVVENSEYIKFFHEQSTHTYEDEPLTDYIICDEIDTVLELLSSKEPILVKMPPEDEEIQEKGGGGERTLIPLKIRPYFITSRQRTDGDSVLVEGMLSCCNSHEFEVRIAGEVKSGLLSKNYLLPIDDSIALEACCKKCGKVITVFDSRQDGYNNCDNKHSEQSATKPFVCKKCSGDTFSVSIKYEYPDMQELTELGIVEKDNAFTWIWITLQCTSCGKKYINFIDYETG